MNGSGHTHMRLVALGKPFAGFELWWLLWSEFVSERACAPPALSALNLGRLLRVVLPVKRDCSVDNPNSPADYSRLYSCPACMKSSTGLALHFMRTGLPRRSWACPAALRGVLKGEGASETTAPKCTKVHHTTANTTRSFIASLSSSG